MRICILGSKTRKEHDLWLLEEAKKRFGRATYAEIPFIRIENGEAFFKNLNLADYDCILPRIPATYRHFGYNICKLLEHRVYMPIKPESIIVAHNKFLTLLALNKAGIPTPKTYLALSRQSVRDVLDKVTYPVVIKLLHGSLGKGVMFAESRESAAPLIDTIESMNEPFIVEEYIKNPGEDIRAMVIGNEVISMRRIAGKGERRANIGIGGKGKKIKLSDELKELAIKSARAIGLGIAGIDIIIGDEGKPRVIEANVNVNFDEITKVTEINIAEKMINYVWHEAETSIKGTTVLGSFFRMIDELKWR
jgi:ribosomal protein S6--L-glutamate ligase